MTISFNEHIASNRIRFYLLSVLRLVLRKRTLITTAFLSRCGVHQVAQFHILVCLTLQVHQPTDDAGKFLRSLRTEFISHWYLKKCYYFVSQSDIQFALTKIGM